MTNKETQDMTGTGMYIELPKEKIYESPDKGKTVYEREFGDYYNRKLVKDPEPLCIDDPEPERYYDWMLWKLRQERRREKESG